MKELVFTLPDELVDQFELTVQLMGDNKNVLEENFIRNYLGTALQSAADRFRTPDANNRATHSNINSASRVTAETPPPNTAIPPHTPPRSESWQDWGRQEWGKAINRIPRWARNPQQNNHKILRAFFELQQEMKRVSLDALRMRCSDPIGHPKTYVPHFDNNFAQMKFDNGHSHGKVFEERDGYITIWDRISDTLQKYHDNFMA